MRQLMPQAPIRQITFVTGVALTLLIGLALTSASARAGTLSGAPACAAPFEESQLLHRLERRQGDGTRLTLGLYAPLCKGTLFLVDLDRRRAWPVNGAATFFELKDVRFVEERDRVLAIEAEYATGIGPTGATPFRRITFMRLADDGEWRVLDADVIEDDDQ